MDYWAHNVEADLSFGSKSAIIQLFPLASIPTTITVHTLCFFNGIKTFQVKVFYNAVGKKLINLEISKGKRSV